MAEDLGAWPPEQATVLLETLNRAGLSPQAKRTREGISVTVPDDQAEEAQRQLVANMDAIARAARAEPAPQRKRARRGTEQHPAGGASSAQDRPLTSQRMLRIARPMSLILLGLLLAAIAQGPLRLVVVVATVAGIVYLIGRQAQKDGDDH